MVDFVRMPNSGRYNTDAFSLEVNRVRNIVSQYKNAKLDQFWSEHKGSGDKICILHFIFTHGDNNDKTMVVKTNGFIKGEDHLDNIENLGEMFPGFCGEVRC